MARSGDAGRRALAALAAAASILLFGGTAAFAQQRQVEVVPSIAIQETYTTNVDLDRAGSRDDFVTEIRPSVRFDVRRPRALLVGSLTAPILLYARESDRNAVRPHGDLLGRLTAVDRFLFIEAAVDVSQQFLDPLGPRPEDVTTLTRNRFTATTYRITPYIQSEAAGGIRYVLRNDNIWSNVSRLSTITNRGDETLYQNRLFGQVVRDPRPFGWAIDAERTQYEFPDDRGSQRIQLARATVSYAPDRDWQLLALAGYEKHDIPGGDDSGAIWGAGFRWRPSNRTSVNALWQERVFGSAYEFTFDHRTRMTAVNLRLARRVVTYADQLGVLTPGTGVASLVDSILRARIPDPVERATAVDRFIDSRGLPDDVVEPLAIFAQRIVRQTAADLTMGITGVRNTLFFRAFRSETDPLGDIALDLPSLSSRTTQWGGSVVWTYAPSPLSSLTATATATRTKDETDRGESDHHVVRLLYSRALAPHTRGNAGARYQSGDRSAGDRFHEFAVYVGVQYTYR